MSKFQKGDRVTYKGDGMTGIVTDIYPERDMYDVKFDDGYADIMFEEDLFRAREKYAQAPASPWVSINERLPEPDEHVLAAVPADFADPDRYEVAYWDGEDWYTAHGEHIRPTHWANIPMP